MSAALGSWRVVVTRPAGQSASFRAALEARGATVVAMPTITIVDPEDGGTALRDATARLSSFDWVVFTSENGVARTVATLGDAQLLGTLRLAAIGTGTAEALARHGLTADLVPERFVGEALVEAFASTSGRGRLLLARAGEARDVVPDGLRALGFDVEVVEAYRTVPVRPDEATRLAARAAQAITFTSPSTVGGYLAFNEASALPAVVAVIGPVTAEAAERAGLRVDVEAAVHTAGGLVAALCDYASADVRRSGSPRRPRRLST